MGVDTKGPALTDHVALGSFCRAWRYFERFSRYCWVSVLGKKSNIEALLLQSIGGDWGVFRGVLVGAFLIGIIESLLFLFARFGPWISWIAIYTVFCYCTNLQAERDFWWKVLGHLWKNFSIDLNGFILAAFLLLLPTFTPLYYLIHSIDVIIIIYFAVSFKFAYGYMKEFLLDTRLFGLGAYYNGMP